MNEDPITFILLIVGCCFIFGGAVMLVVPPRKINNLYGYRTKRSKRSKPAWDFAQKYSAVRLLESGVLAILISSLNYFIHPSITLEGHLAIMIAVLGIGLVNVALRTEGKLKKWY